MVFTISKVPTIFDAIIFPLLFGGNSLDVELVNTIYGASGFIVALNGTTIIAYFLFEPNLTFVHTLQVLASFAWESLLMSHVYVVII